MLCVRVLPRVCRVAGRESAAMSRRRKLEAIFFICTLYTVLYLCACSGCAAAYSAQLATTLAGYKTKWTDLAVFLRVSKDDF